jgi:hypothetical protein
VREKSYKIGVLASCPTCGAEWSGGHERPLYPMKAGLRVFYRCGCSVSIKERSEDHVLLLVKNCGTQEDL